MERKRKYSEEFLKFGFTMLTTSGIEKPQCVLCRVVLSSESMKHSKLKHHLEKHHSEHAKKDLTFFRQQETICKHQRLDPAGSSQQTSTAFVQVSYEVALEIARQKRPYTMGEELIKPCMLKMVKSILGDSSEAKMQRISLSKNTIHQCIADMSKDVKEQILNEIKISPVFSLHFDESTDVSSCSQVLVFVKYINSDDIKEEFLFCCGLEDTTSGENIFEKINTFFENGGLKWENVCGVSTDFAKALLGSKSHFMKKVKELAPQARRINFAIDSYVLTIKSLSTPMQEVLNVLIKMVNFVKTCDLNTRLLKEMCKDMDTDHELLLLYTSKRWLLKGTVLNRVIELKDEIRSLLEVQGKQDLLAYINDKNCLQRVAYLADIFKQQNCLYLKLQGKETSIIELHDHLSAFVSKLQNWRRKVNLGNISMFEKLSCVVADFESEINEILKEEITKHLEFLENELQRYIPELKEEETKMTLNPFSSFLDVASIPDELQDEFLDLRNDSLARILFNEKFLTQFWCSMYHSYPNVSMLALRVLVPFVSTYHCENGFSTLLHLKTQDKNNLDVENDMRLALTKTHPRIWKLVDDTQCQPSN